MNDENVSSPWDPADPYKNTRQNIIDTPRNGGEEYGNDIKRVEHCVAWSTVCYFAWWRCLGRGWNGRRRVALRSEVIDGGLLGALAFVGYGGHDCFSGS